MYKVWRYQMLNWGLGYVIELKAQIHQKVVEIHRLSVNRLLIAKTRARAYPGPRGFS